MEVSADYELLTSNNSYEAHALYHILEKVEISKHSPGNSFPFKVGITESDSQIQGTTILVNLDLMLLAVTGRGSFNPYVNAVFASLMQKAGLATKEIPDQQALCESALKLCQESKNHSVGQSNYTVYLETFVWGSPSQIADSLVDLTADLWFSVLKNDKDSLDFVEKLLVGLLGHSDSKVRDLAVKHLNAFYDDTDWQLMKPFKPKISTVGKEFIIREIVELTELQNVVLELHAPGFHENSENYVLSYHIPEIRSTPSGTLVKLDFGNFPRCGFYDWRFSVFKNGTLQPLVTSFKKNRGANSIDTTPLQGRFIVHPADTKDLQIHEIFIDFQDANFDVSTGEIKERGNFRTVKNSLKERYSTGINCLYLMGALERDNGTNLENEDASPLALVCRRTACTMLGGGPEFSSLMKESKEVGIKILVDCVARISSKNYHRRYKNKLFYVRNNHGLPVVCYGTDGRSINYEDSAMLNYRKHETWNMLVQDVLEFCKTYGVDGIHVDNAHAWPQIMELDRSEMYKKDSDGEPHYTTQEIFDGLVVKRNEFFAYWSSSLREKWPNPIFVKLCKEIWRVFPEFYVVGDIWSGTGEERDKCIVRSGPIPRLYDLPVKLSAIFGKKLHKNGKWEVTENKDVGILKKWYEESRQNLPEGAVVIQSSTGHSLPYPALLYGRGAWAAVDVMFFLPDIPMTFIGEQEGHAFRATISSVYETDNEEIPIYPSKLSGNNLIDLEQSYNYTPKIPRLESAASLSLIPDMKKLLQKEKKFHKELGPEYGFDLKMIGHHYRHRRAMRLEKEVLRYGGLIPLVMKHDHGWHKQVLSFARNSPEEIAVITINLNEHPVKGYLDIKALEKALTEMNENATVYSFGEWFNPDSDDYYFKEEIVHDLHDISLLPYRSEIRAIYPSDVSSDLALQRSIERLKQKLVDGHPIDGNYFVIKLLKLLENENLAQTFKEIGNVLGQIQKHFLEAYSVAPEVLIKNIKTLDEKKAGKLIGICDKFLMTPEKNSHTQNFAEAIVSRNRMGPIVFSCPELGRFSTAGGLGVMVDELSQGLVELGEEVWVISPYYERNKHGHTNYLSDDPANVNWIFNIEVRVGSEPYTLGVFRGYEKGVHLLFLHNSFLLPHVYADGRGHWVIKQLVAWGKGCLEILCQLQVIPSILVTNDWFTALIPAYAKVGAFGNVFEGTTFLHVVHNLDASYEGRLYPDKNENCYENIHNLPRHIFVDPYWTREVVNPSRCAIMMSDQWATVSPSYRNELLSSSPLKELLKHKDQPFAFPNGIPMKSRLKRLEGLGTHLEAKRSLQQRYFHYGDLDNSVCLFGFVGRIAEQKGVHLILDAAEHLIPASHFKVQFLIGGPANYRDPYAAKCAHRLKHLREKYPNNFFADPDSFFYEGPLVNLGCDYGLMPSMFEPGGIVQHEFFVACTPVIAFKTGGLRDTVTEFNQQKAEGCGFLFEAYNVGDFIWAINRSLEVYFHGDYNKLRTNSFKATMDGSHVSRAWSRELYRLKQKIFIEPTVRWEVHKKLENVHWTALDFKDELPENKTKTPGMKRSPSGALLEQAAKMSKPVSEDTKKQVLFRYQTPGMKVGSVQLVGSFDKWQIRHSMTFDHTKNMWHITLQLPKGRYHYKFVIDGTQWVYSHDHHSESDSSGNMNNVLEVN